MVESIFDRFDSDIGLPGAAVTGIAQDRAGFLWLATQTGLARFDGYRAQAFLHDAKVAGSLPDNVLNKILIDADDDVWVGSLTAGLARYDRSHNRFDAYTAGPDGLSNNGVFALEDDAGGLWIGTGGGLDFRPRGGGPFQHYRHDAGKPESLPGNGVNALARDRGGVLWVGTSGGLARRDPRSGAFIVPAADSDAAAAALKAPISAMLCDSRGRIWFTPEGLGLGMIDPASGKATLLPLSGAEQLASARVIGMIEAAPDTLWLGTFGHGVAVVDIRSGRMSALRNNPRTQFSLPDDYIRSIARDRQGLVWVGTQRGLARHDPMQAGIRTLFGATRDHSLSNPEVPGILVAHDGRVWVAHGAGVDIIDPVAGRVASLPTVPNGSEHALPQQLVWGLAEGPDGSVYLASWRGLYRADPHSFQVGRIALLPTNPFDRVNTVQVVGQRLWVGAHQSGLLSFELGGAGPLPASLRAYGGLTDSRIEVILPAPDGRLWVGTYSGLNRLDPATGRTEQFQADSKDPHALSSGLISSLLFDRQQRLWIGTFGGAINLLEHLSADGKAQFRHIGADQGMPGDVAAKLLPDRQGRIWASTSQGLAVIDSATLAVSPVGLVDGVRIRGSWLNSGAATAQGELLFGGQGGITIVQPERIGKRPGQGRMAVTALKVGARAVSIEGFNQAGKNQLLQVAGNDSGFQVDFALLDYRSPQLYHYQYRLEGFDRDWVSTDSNRRVASYTNLEPGRYQLRLRGSSNGGAWIEREQPLEVEVLPAWYQTWWARTLALLAGLALIGAALWKRTTYLQQRQRRLEKLVEQRTSALSASVEQLRRTQSRLVQQEKLASLGQLVAGVAHEINTPVGVAIGAASQLKNETAALQKMAAEGRMKRSDFDSYLQLTGDLASMLLMNSQRAGTLISSFKQVAADRTSDVRREINLMDYIQEVLWSLDPLLKRSSVQVRLEGSATVRLVTYPGLLAQVLTNFVQNALSHAFGGVEQPEILIVVERSEDELARFSFSDNGVGMAPEVCQRIFDPFFTTKRNDGGTGLGLHLVYNLVTSPLGGEITVSSQPGHGTSFRVGLQNFKP